MCSAILLYALKSVAESSGSSGPGFSGSAVSAILMCSWRLRTGSEGAVGLNTEDISVRGTPGERRMGDEERGRKKGSHVRCDHYGSRMGLARASRTDFQQLSYPSTA